MRVFVGGSKALKALPKAIADKIIELMEQDAEIVVGDCRGADALVQQFLADSHYRHVEVYATEGKVRHNLGDWKAVGVSPTEISVTSATSGPCYVAPVEWWVSSKRSKRGGYNYYLAKDVAMALSADCGLMAWNGRSKGTLVNLLMLVAQGKRADVVLPESNEVARAESFDDVRALLPARNPHHVASGGLLDTRGYERAIDEFVPSRDMCQSLKEHPLTKEELIDLVVGSPTSLEKKFHFFARNSGCDDCFHELVDEVESKVAAIPEDEPMHSASQPCRVWGRIWHSSFGRHRNELMRAINALEVGQGELIYRKSVWDEQPVLYEEHEQGIAPFSSLKAALEDLRFEMKSEEWDDDAPCWSVLEKWRLAKSGTWKNPYVYYAIGDEVVFFEKRRYDAKEHRWRASDRTYAGDFTGRLNVRTPFKTGDIATLDCRPFAPLRHGLILLPERDGATDRCFPRALVRCAGYSTKQHKDSWSELSVKHGGGLHISMPGYSPLYRMEVWDGDLPEEEQVLLEVQKWLDGNQEKGEALAEAMSESGSEIGTEDLLSLIRTL